MSAYPWDRRPDELPLTVEEVCQALAESKGVILTAAARLKVGTLVLRKFVERSARARQVQAEMGKCRIERAIVELDKAQGDEDSRRVDWSTRYILNSENARPYGFGPSGDKSEPPVLHLIQAAQWPDGTRLGPPLSPPAPAIELHPDAMPPSKAAE